MSSNPAVHIANPELSLERGSDARQVAFFEKPNRNDLRVFHTTLYAKTRLTLSRFGGLDGNFRSSGVGMRTREYCFGLGKDKPPVHDASDDSGQTNAKTT
jgi:hypothetical protein